MASKVRKELLALQQASKDNILKAEAVVVWARKHRQSALYRQFDWSDRAAANKYRLWQARQLITVNLNILSAGTGPKVVSLSIDRKKPGGGYRVLDDVLDSPTMSRVMLTDALSELERVQLKYQRLKALSPVWRAIEKVRRQASMKQAA